MTDKQEKTTDNEASVFDELSPTTQLYKDNAKVFKETHIITHTPQYTEKVTEESLTEHVEFIRDNVTAASIATSELAYQYAEENKDFQEWRGKLDLPGISSEVVVHPREGFHNPDTGKDEYEYGHHDVVLDFHLGEKHTTILEALHEVDAKRYEALFSDND